MAEIIYQDPVKEIRGAVENGGIINRRKVYRDNKGRIIHEGTTEAYAVRNPRNWKKNPPKGEELNKINRFRQACNLTTAILHSATADISQLATKEQIDQHNQLLKQYNDFQARFLAQLNGKPDPQAPLDPKTNKPKRYFRLDNFIRAMVYQQLKQQ